MSTSSSNAAVDGIVVCTHCDGQATTCAGLRFVLFCLHSLQEIIFLLEAQSSPGPTSKQLKAEG